MREFSSAINPAVVNDTARWTRRPRAETTASTAVIRTAVKAQEAGRALGGRGLDEDAGAAIGEHALDRPARLAVVRDEDVGQGTPNRIPFVLIELDPKS